MTLLSKRSWVMTVPYRLPAYVYIVLYTGIGHDTKEFFYFILLLRGSETSAAAMPTQNHKHCCTTSGKVTSLIRITNRWSQMNLQTPQTPDLFDRNAPTHMYNSRRHSGGVYFILVLMVDEIWYRGGYNSTFWNSSIITRLECCPVATQSALISHPSSCE